MCVMRSRGWFFTWNNYETLLGDPLFEYGCSYCVYQEEVGDEGTPHLQGYIYFPNAKTLSAVKDLMGSEVHLEVPRSDAHAMNYCMKEESRVGGPYEFGVKPEQGKRNDLAMVKRAVDSGFSRAELYESSFSSMMRYERSILNYKRFKAPKRDFQPIIIVFYGVTGYGKSRTAMCLANMLGSVYVVPNAKGSGLYFDGYDGENTLVFHEMYGSTMPWSFLLQLTDRYPFVLPEHGSAGQQCCSRYMIFCSNKSPREWYKDVSCDPLLRRIHILWFFGPRERVRDKVKGRSMLEDLKAKSRFVFYPGVHNPSPFSPKKK